MRAAISTGAAGPIAALGSSTACAAATGHAMYSNNGKLSASGMKRLRDA